jgi:hypothetical protein
VPVRPGAVWRLMSWGSFLAGFALGVLAGAVASAVALAVYVSGGGTERDER